MDIHRQVHHPAFQGCPDLPKGGVGVGGQDNALLFGLPVIEEVLAVKHKGEVREVVTQEGGGDEIAGHFCTVVEPLAADIR